mgnify:FL=1
MKKKIALYISSLRRGGAERVMANLAGYFHRQGYQVLMVTTRREETEYEIPRGIVRRISEPSSRELRGGRISNFRKRFLRLREIWKEEKPDVILSFIGKNNMMAILTSRGLQIPVAVSVRGEPMEEYYNKGLRLMARQLFRLADGVVLQTGRSCGFFPESVQKKAVILRNPVHPDFFREPYEGEREKTVVAVGRVDENKNHELLIRAFARIAEDFPGYRLLIYGEGEKRKELKALAKDLGLEERILLPGNEEQVEEVIYRARVFVLPSNTEGMPNTLIEAMLLGITVIATDCPCGGPAELIVHGENGLLTPVGDVEKMKENLQRVLAHPREADRMGRNAARIRSLYEPEAVYGGWKAYLEGLMTKR